MPTMISDERTSFRWPDTAPPEPPYVEGPLVFPADGPRPPLPPWPFADGVAPGPAPAAPIETRSSRRNVVAGVVLAVLVFFGSLAGGLAIADRSHDVAAPPTTSTPSTSTPTTRPTSPSTRVPSTTTPSTPPTSRAPSTSPTVPDAAEDPSDPSGSGGPATPPSTVPESGSSNGQATPGTTPPDLSAAADKVIPGVVDITSQLGNATGAGTGVVISATGDVITNNHVIADATQIEATIPATGETFTATVVNTDPTQDIAVLHLAAAHDLNTVTIGDSDEVAVGDAVAAVGNAGGAGGTPAVAGGHVTALGQDITASDQDGSNAQNLKDLIQVDAKVVPGDSGGPLINDRGEVIGIDVAASASNGRRRSTANEGFAIPINRAMSVAKRLLANPRTTNPSGGGVVGRAYLGVASVDGANPPGALVQRVQPGTPASDAGLQAGDTITAIGSTTVRTANQLSTALGTLPGGTTTTITWSRDGTEQQASITLSSR